MGHTFFPAFDAGPVNNNACRPDNPAKDGDVLKFFFSQWPDLGGHCQANARDVQIGGMIAGVDIGFSCADVFFSDDLIGDKIQFAEGPRPQFQELIADRTVLFSDQEREEDPRQVEDHEHEEDEDYPSRVKS